MKNLHLYDFGIFIELMPDEEEKALLENNIQVALGQKLIELDDAIDLRGIRNIKLANQMLKIKRRQKQERDQAIAQQNIEAQSQANAQAQEVAAQAEIQKTQAQNISNAELESVKNNLKMEYLRQEVQSKKELMILEFELNSGIKKEEREIAGKLESVREDRKDQRIDRQAAYQKEMINQRTEGNSLKKFESSGNDIVTGDAGIDRF